ncbi:unnamed protein product [Ectocarpus sp. 8 AP-2014]
MNAECPVRSVGFFGLEEEGVHCCTNTDTLSFWHAAGAQRMKDFGDVVRASARGELPADADVGVGDGAAAASAPGEGEGVALAAWAAAAAVAVAREDWGFAVDCIVDCRYDATADRLRLVTSSSQAKRAW